MKLFGRPVADEEHRERFALPTLAGEGQSVERVHGHCADPPMRMMLWVTVEGQHQGDCIKYFLTEVLESRS